MNTCCKQFGFPIGALALNFVIGNSNIDKVVIGVETALQLQENISRIKVWPVNEEIIACVNKIAVKQKELLNPANWN